MAITRARLRDDGVVVQIMPDGREVPIESRTDWARVDAMTDEDIARAVAEDPDAVPPLTDERLAAARTIRTVDIAATRRLGPSQTERAAWFGISPGTLRNWEQAAGSARAGPIAKVALGGGITCREWLPSVSNCSEYFVVRQSRVREGDEAPGDADQGGSRR